MDGLIKPPFIMKKCQFAQTILDLKGKSLVTQYSSPPKTGGIILTVLEMNKKVVSTLSTKSKS
jgi:hypothetical protein